MSKKERLKALVAEIEESNGKGIFQKPTGSSVSLSCGVNKKGGKR